MRRDVSRIVGILLVALCVATNGWAAIIIATVDRDPVRLDESFVLALTADGSVDADPDFRSLEQDFDILHRSHSTNMRVMNGRVSNTRQWTLVLMPKRLGELTIPAISFGNDRSPMVRVTVISTQHAQPGLRAEDLFLEVDAQPRQAFVQAQILYTARLYRAVDIENASLTEPTLNDADAVIKKLGEDRIFQTQRDGRRYHVVERRYVLFPQRSGTLTINPVVFQGQIVPQRRSFFRPQSGQTKRVRSDAITLTIDPVPASFPGKTWLPARDIHLSEAWLQNPPQFMVGEPVTRTLSVIAEGLTSAQLPVINASVPASIKQYPDQPVQEDQDTRWGIAGLREEKVALIPTQAGRLVLPAIEIPWWNTQTNTMEFARLPERMILVEPGVGIQRESPQQAPLASIDPFPSETVQIQTGVQGFRIWPWLTGFLALGWVVAGVLWWRHRRGVRSIATTRRQDVARSSRSVERNLKQACERGDAPAAKAVLLEWGKLHWPDNPPHTIGAIAERSSEPFRDEIRRLNQALYGADSAAWNGETLWKAFEQASAQETQIRKPTEDGLEPLWVV